jgi:hypothetical protein
LFCNICLREAKSIELIEGNEEKFENVKKKLREIKCKQKIEIRIVSENSKF